VTANGGDDILVERFSNVRFDLSSSTDYAPTVVNANSSLIRLSISANQATNILTKSPDLSMYALYSGSDGVTAITTTDFTTANVISDFSTINRPLVVFAPELEATLGTSANMLLVYDNFLTWAATGDGTGFIVIDGPAAQNTDGTVRTSVTDMMTYAESLTPDNGRGAAYFPSLFISDPIGRSSASLRKVGPSGAVAGLYLSTDAKAGPFKSPAGVGNRLNGIVGVERGFTTAELDTLNSGVFTVSGTAHYASPVNPIRNLPGAGFVVMGARTLLNDGTANKYINMRRSLIYVEKRLRDLMQFALFENNDEVLWRSIRTVLGTFLNSYRNQGGLRGATPDASFYVKCDAENNPISSIQQGEVHVQVGVALQYPTEFVVINISQTTGN
jgi:phage tail sheath protein FI